MIKLDYFPFTEVSYLSKRDVKFQVEPEIFEPFISFPFNEDSFLKKINDRKQFPIDRNLLTEVLNEQYSKANITDPPNQSIELLLQDNTFTVVTAHQPSLMTGPLYFIYKIISVINLAETLSLKYPEYNILPVFIIGSEDHDFEEVNHFNIFNKTITWENNESGPIGRMSIESLQPVLKEIYAILGENDHAISLKNIIEFSFKDAKNYNIAVLRMVHQLFKKYNLITLITDHKSLKKSFVKSIEKEIFEHASQELIIETQLQLEKLDLKSQAHAREINFFYLQDGKRDRIVQEEGIFKVLDTELEFSEEQLRLEINNFPERFSPNVVMRPIYQESILPNLAYLGGGGEIAYWTERKTQFEAFGKSFPILVRRNSVLWISKSDSILLQKYDISLENIFNTEEQWIKNFVKGQASAQLEFLQEFDLFNKSYDLLAEKAAKIDASLYNSIKASHAKDFKSFEQLSSRLIRVEKERHEKDINKIRKIKSKLFPGGGLQERKENFMSYYLIHGEAYFDILKKNLDPFNHSFVVISEVE